MTDDNATTCALLAALCHAVQHDLVQSRIHHHSIDIEIPDTPWSVSVDTDTLRMILTKWDEDRRTGRNYEMACGGMTEARRVRQLWHQTHLKQNDRRREAAESALAEVQEAVDALLPEIPDELRW